MDPVLNEDGSSRAPFDGMDEGKFRRKRKKGLKMMGHFGFLGLIASSATFILGVVCVVIFSGEGEVPYVIPIGIIAGVLSLIPSVVAMRLRSTGMAFELSGNKSRDDVPISVKGKILIVFIFAVINFTLLFFCAFGSFYGMALCVSDDENCEEDHDEKLALSVVIAVLCVLLWISCFFLSIWFCLYGHAFGFKNRREQDRNIRLMQHRILQQQRQIAYMQSQIDGEHQSGFRHASAPNLTEKWP